MTARHDLHVRLDEADWRAVREVAAQLRMPGSGALRLLLRRGLDREAADPSTAAPKGRRRQRDTGRDALEVALATLLAAEHTLLVLADMTPGGNERIARLAEAAGPAAQRRLARLNAAPPPEERA